MIGKRAVAASIVAFLLLPAALLAQADSASRSWNQPVEPFRVAGNVYYVGASDVTSFLITDPAGHVIIDAGFVETVPQIISNIRKLGFDPMDVRVLLNTQAHEDHAGGFADLKGITRARLLISAADAVQIENGGTNDFAWGDRLKFPAAKVDGIVVHGDTVRVGNTRLVANVTAGHTPGCTSWTLQTNHNNRVLNVLFHCSSSVPGYTLVNNPKYPQIADDYRRSFEILTSLPCDVPLSAHGRFFGLLEKAAKVRAGEADVFVDPEGCRRMIANGRAAFERELARQRE